CEEAPERVLEEKAEHACRDRPDDEQPPELRVGVVLADPAVAQAACEPAQDAHPVAPEEEEEDEGRREVRRDEEAQEVRVVLVDVPAEEAREDDARAETRDREELGHALDDAQDDRLPVGNRPREDHESDAARARERAPVWNHAKITSATPRKNDARPCLMW